MRHYRLLCVAAMTQRKRTAILISGRGSNMMSLVEAARAPSYPAEVVLVLSNRPDAAGLAWAKAQGIPTLAIDHKRFASREVFEAEVNAALEASGSEIVALAGFMRLVTAGFVERWRDRLINIHPSLLPSFKGLHTHERALAEGVRIAGCTVHLVRAEMDTGPIIAQAAVPVLDGDTPDTLAARVLAAEHKLYPHALALLARGAVRLTDGRATIVGASEPPQPLFSPPVAERA